MTEIRQREIFDDWMKKHKGLFLKIIRAYTFNELDREDLFQEVAIQVWRSIPNFREESSESTWLYRVSLNTSITWKRNKKKYDENHGYVSDTDQLLKKEENNVDERLEWLYREIAKLDVIDRSLCLLMFDGFSYQEMAEILGISESNVGVKIHRVKQYLIKQTKEYDHHGI